MSANATREPLLRSHYVYQVPTPIDEREAARQLANDVRVPHPVEQRRAHARAGSGSAGRCDFGLAAARLPSSVQGIMARNFAPTCSIWLFCAARRSSLKRAAPARHAAIHSLAHTPL